MYCDRCGTQIQGSERFCPSCGNSIQPSSAAPAPSGPRAGRVGGHIRFLGVIWIVWSILHFIPAFGAMVFAPILMRTAAWPNAHHFGFPEALIAGVGGLIGALSILGLVAGWALLAYQPWARMFLIVMACLALLNLPFGTALGAYTLWVLLPRESEQEYRRMATG